MYRVIATALSIGVFACALIYRYEAGFRFIDHGRTIDVRQLRVDHLQAVQSAARLADLRQDVPTLVVVFSAADCIATLGETDDWNELAVSASSAQSPQLKVIGIAVRSSWKEVLAYTKAFNVRFPVYADVDGAFERTLGTEVETPLKIALSARGRPIAAESGQKGPRSLAERLRREVAGQTTAARSGALLPH